MTDRVATRFERLLMRAMSAFGEAERDRGRRAAASAVPEPQTQPQPEPAPEEPAPSAAPEPEPPSAVFDAAWYLERYPDAAASGLDPYRHYLEIGVAERRDPGPLFDADLYLERNPDVAEAGVDPLAHFVRHGAAEGRRPNWFFDPAWYVERHPEAATSATDPLDHYVRVGAAAGYDPGPDFDHDWYVAQAGIDPAVVNPLAHYIWIGCGVGHTPVRCETDDKIFPLRHQILAGYSFFRTHGLRFDVATGPGPVRSAAAALAARAPPAIDAARPRASVIVPAYGQLRYVLNALHALALQRSRHGFEVIVADDATPDEDMSCLATIPWIRYERADVNGGFVGNCNRAAALARGDILIFLNSDTRVAAGWLDALVDSFARFPRAGVVGSKLIDADGGLQEAGGIFWRNGNAWNYGRGGDPADPRYCYARQTDYCSGAALAVRRAVWDDLGGFDRLFAPAYAEDADLAFRARAAGHEVWYQPAAQVVHYEGITHGRDVGSGVKAHQVANLARFAERWRGVLVHHGAEPGDPEREANRYSGPVVLVADAEPPAPDRDSGSFMTMRILELLMELGYRPVFVALDNFSYVPGYTSALQAAGIACHYPPFDRDVAAVVARYRALDYLLAFRHGVFGRIAPLVRAASARTRVLFHNVDLHYLRAEREADLAGDRQRRLLAHLVKESEFECFLAADASIVHTPVERDVVAAEMPIRNVCVFPYLCEEVLSPPGFAERADILFVGNFRHPPNVDAVAHLVGAVLPLIEAELPADARVVVVGQDAPPELLMPGSERVRFVGAVPDLAPWFDRARLSIAPLRYGAGIKGKIVQSLARGVPVVTTSVGAEGMPIEPGRHALVADAAAAFAAAILDVYRSESTWTRLRTEGRALAEREWSRARAREQLAAAIETADAFWLERRRRRLARMIAARDGGLDAPGDGVEDA